MLLRSLIATQTRWPPFWRKQNIDCCTYFLCPPHLCSVVFAAAPYERVRGLWGLVSCPSPASVSLPAMSSLWVLREQFSRLATMVRVAAILCERGEPVLALRPLVFLSLDCRHPLFVETSDNSFCHRDNEQISATVFWGGAGRPRAHPPPGGTTSYTVVCTRPSPSRSTHVASSVPSTALGSTHTASWRSYPSTAMSNPLAV